MRVQVPSPSPIFMGKIEKKAEAYCKANPIVMSDDWNSRYREAEAAYTKARLAYDARIIGKCNSTPCTCQTLPDYAQLRLSVTLTGATVNLFCQERAALARAQYDEQIFLGYKAQRAKERYRRMQF